MASKSLAGQMIRFHKSSLEKTFMFADMVQDMSETWFSMLLEKSNWVPAEGVQLTDEWIRMHKNGRKIFKTFVDGVYDKILATCAETNAGAAQNAQNTAHIPT